jgi:hypothetical protein
VQQSHTRIPVVTLVTDIAGTDRLNYVGLDNAGKQQFDFRLESELHPASRFAVGH